MIQHIKNLFAQICRPFKDLLYYLQLKRKYSGKVSFIIGCKIGDGSTFEGCNTLGDNCSFNGSMGYGSYMSSDSQVDGKVGRFTSIGPEVMTPRGIHPYREPYVATSPMFFSLNRITGHTFATHQSFNEWKAPVEIGNDCWIGARAIITGGVKIFEGGVVYANAVVTKDVPPYAIVAGVPAKVIGYRYDEETIAFLLKLQWWNKGIDWLTEHWELFNDIDKLKAYFVSNPDEL